MVNKIKQTVDVPLAKTTTIWRCFSQNEFLNLKYSKYVSIAKYTNTGEQCHICIIRELLWNQ